MNTFKDQQQINVMLNRMVRGKVPPGFNWAKYHRGFKLERLTPYDLAANVWRGYGFCPVYEGDRKQESFVEAHHMAFDFDDAPLQQLADIPWVDWFASFGYTTPSHTASSPKCRIVFVFDDPITDANRYRILYHALAWRFGEEGVQTDPACKDVLRLYYGSPKCDVWDNWSVMQGGVQDEFIEQWKAESKVIGPPPRPVYDRPARNVDEANIRSALQYIPPWGDYHDWLQVLMAVHSVLPGSDGVALCESWSPGYSGEIEKKFASFDANRPDGVTIGTLLKMAQDNGWRAPASSGANKRNGARQYDLRNRL